MTPDVPTAPLISVARKAFDLAAANIAVTRLNGLCMQVSDDRDAALEKIANLMESPVFGARLAHIIREMLQAPSNRVAVAIAYLLGPHIQKGIIPDRALRQATALWDLTEADIEVLIWLGMAQADVRAGKAQPGFEISKVGNASERFRAMQWWPSNVEKWPDTLGDEPDRIAIVLGCIKRLEARWLMQPPDKSGLLGGESSFYDYLVSEMGVESAAVLDTLAIQHGIV